MSRTRTRWRLGLTATALLVASAVVPAPSNAAAADVTDYAIKVDPKGSGAKIDDTMYGAFFEDINRAADGGLYAELVQNRSFEYSTADTKSYTPLTSWEPSGTVQAVSDDGRLNARNRTYLALSGGSSVTNSGYSTGIRVESGKVYDFSVWARADQAAPLTVTLHDADGALAQARRVTARGGWAKYSARFTASRSSTTGRLTVAADSPVSLDMVSLIPRDTFKGHGLRKDLAEKIAALHPGFVRFPGGCLVNTGSMKGYDEASGYERKRSYQWKDTIGPVEQRATNANFWGYNQSYGIGYYEYFQFAEDIGAMPLPVVPALVTGCGQNKATDDDALLKRHIQDTLDLIEFANGPVTSEWGRKRAQMGHPKPFHLTHIEVGNGRQWGSFTDDKPAEPFRQVVTRDAKTGGLIVKVVNAQSAQARTSVDLGAAKVAKKAQVTTLAAAPDAVNSETATAVAPVTSTFEGVADKFTYTFPANSVTFLRIKKA